MHRMHASSSILLNHHRYDGKKEIFNKIGVYDRSDDLFVIVYYFEVLGNHQDLPISLSCAQWTYCRMALPKNPGQLIR
jgi:hypothetical protein